MRTRGSAHEKGDTKKTNKDKTKKDEMLQNELANYKVLSYSQTEENEKKIEADMIVKSLPEFHLKMKLMMMITMSLIRTKNCGDILVCKKHSMMN